MSDKVFLFHKISFFLFRGAKNPRHIKYTGAKIQICILLSSGLYRRLRNRTESATARGLRLAPITAGEEFHLALKIISANIISLCAVFVNGRIYKVLCCFSTKSHSCFKYRNLTEDFKVTEACRNKEAVALVKRHTAVTVHHNTVALKSNK